MLDTVLLPILTVKHVTHHILIDCNLATDIFSNVYSPSTDNVIHNYRDNLASVYLHLGKFGGSSTGNLSHTELRQFIFKIVQLLEQLLFLLAPKISCLDLGLTHQKDKRL